MAPPPSSQQGGCYRSLHKGNTQLWQASYCRKWYNGVNEYHMDIQKDAELRKEQFDVIFILLWWTDVMISALESYITAKKTIFIKHFSQPFWKCYAWTECHYIRAIEHSSQEYIHYQNDNIKHNYHGITVQDYELSFNMSMTKLQEF